MLILKNISKQYEGSKTIVLNNINLKFENHGLICILGPSGCGKSTLLNLIGGLDYPTEGDILVDDAILGSLNKKDLDYYHNKYVGFIYQNYNLINYLNVVDNIELINKNKRIDELLDYLHIKDKKHQKVNNLSGGEKQRVAIARCLSNDPSVLLCDEPTGALDIKTSNEIMELLKNISKKKLVIVVTHNEELALQYADRIIRLEDGCVISDSKKIIKNVINKYNYSKVKVSRRKIFNIIKKNIISKYKRNILSVAAFSVGLISLSLVLGISSGFNKALEKEEKDSLSKYPIYISKTSTNLDNSLEEIFDFKKETDDNYIYAKSETHENEITEEYINELNSIKENTNYIVKAYLINNALINVVNKKIDDLNIIAGSNLSKENELLLVVNNNRINTEILKSINLKKEKYSYDELVGYEFKLKKKTYKIVGIASTSEDSYLYDLTGLLSISDYFDKEIPSAFFLYPKDYENKQIILKHLDKYKDIEYTDYSTTIKKLSTTIVDAVSMVLLCFSMIALLVSTIMIGIISYISVLERIKEIGLFKSLGLSNRYIKYIFVGENIALGYISSLVSYSVIKLLSIPINNLLQNLTGMSNILLIDSNLLFIILIVSISLNIIGSYFPIRKTKKLKIIDCMKYE
ncbi:MAG: ABC transporter ATP-binding protein/permease [Erysipelotrichales bacterium]|nr:ABC transporter ATP-binding protein/permease [Erysipelotrichales bacterium]